MMWVPQTGAPLEKATAEISRSLWQIAMGQLPPETNPYNVTDQQDGKESISPEARRGLEQLRRDCKAWADLLIREMVRSAPHQIFFATSVSGERVALPHTLLPHRIRKPWPVDESYNSIRPDGYPLEESLTSGDAIRSAYTVSWAPYSFKHGLFEDRIYRSKFHPTPDVAQGTVSLSRMREELEYLKALFFALLKIPHDYKFPVGLKSEIGRIDAYETAISAFAPIEVGESQSTEASIP